MASGPNLHSHTAVGLGFIRSFLVIGLLMTTAGDLSLAEKRSAWIEVRSPNFIVVTNANEQQGRRTAHQFEMIRAVFRDYFGQKDASAEQPITIIATKDEGSLKALLPEFWAKRGSAHPVGVYLGSADANYVALRLDVSLSQQTDEPFEPIYHEYVHYLTRRMIARLPLWMVEGLAEFYGNTRIESDKAFVGAPSTTNVMLLREKKLLPMSTLFEVDASSPYYNEQSKTSIFYAESWALMHYLMARDWQEKTHRVSDFLVLLEKRVDQREAAARTIGDPQDLEPAVRKDIQSASFTAARLDPPKIDDGGFRVRGMSDAESLAVRADFKAHDRHYPEAQAMLEEALKADPKLGAACESMSFLALQQGNVTEAEKWAAQAVALNPQSNRANFYYAWSLLQGGHRNDEESIAKAEAMLRVVVKSDPTFAPAYDGLAFALALPGSHQKLEEAYTMTLRALEYEPGNVHYRLRAVEVLERMGEADNAVRVATLATSMARTPEERTAASEALANAQKFQASKQKIKELNEAQTSGTSSPTTTEAVARSQPQPHGQAPTGEGLAAASVPVQASVKMEMLSDPQGVDFGPYVTKEVLPRLQEAWSKLAPVVARPSGAKTEGKTVIDFAIQKDGSVVGTKLKESSNDPSLDEVALNGLKAATPFQALPAEFKGTSIALRLSLSYSSVGSHESK